MLPYRKQAVVARTSAVGQMPVQRLRDDETVSRMEMHILV